MTREFGLPRSFLIYVLCLPLAVFVGYLLATPDSFRSYAFVILLLFGISIPLWLRHHHEVLVCVWNATIILPLPGKPGLWIVMGSLSLFLSILLRAMNKRYGFLQAPTVTLPLLLLMAVVFLTIIFTGGIGSYALGSEMWGAKRYLGVFGALLGYFALTAQPLPRERGLFYVYMFFLSGLTAMSSDLIFVAGPKFYPLFSFFPTEFAATQALTQGTLFRLTGPTFAALAVYFFMIARYGIHGLLDIRRPWRQVALLLVVAVSLLGGYRSTLIIMFLVFVCQFYLEGLFRSRLFPGVVFIAILLAVFVVVFVDKLPLSVQRSLSFLPLEVDPVAHQDAQGTLDWRLQMWKTLLPEVPKYLLIGKGFTYSGTDYYLTQEAIRRGLYTAFEDTLISGNYHNGILTLIIPFGLLGLIAFLWFCGSALKVLYANYRFGPEVYKRVNTFLLAFFVGRLIFYLVFYGQFDLDFFLFVGAVGLSLSLNGGVCQPPQKELEKSPTLSRQAA